MGRPGCHPIVAVKWFYGSLGPPGWLSVCGSLRQRRRTECPPHTITKIVSGPNDFDRGTDCCVYSWARRSELRLYSEFRRSSSRRRKTVAVDFQLPCIALAPASV